MKPEAESDAYRIDDHPLSGSVSHGPPSPCSVYLLYAQTNGQVALMLAGRFFNQHGCFWAIKFSITDIDVPQKDALGLPLIVIREMRRGIKMAADELMGKVIDIEKEELQRTKKKKPLAARVALSPLTFLAAQGRALVHGPYNPKQPEIEFVQRWIIRFEVPSKKAREDIWTLQMSGSEFEGNVRVGDTIQIKGNFKRGKVIHCNSFINVSAGAEVIAY